MQVRIIEMLLGGTHEPCVSTRRMKINLYNIKFYCKFALIQRQTILNYKNET